MEVQTCKTHTRAPECVTAVGAGKKRRLHARTSPSFACEHPLHPGDTHTSSSLTHHFNEHHGHGPTLYLNHPRLQTASTDLQSARRSTVLVLRAPTKSRSSYTHLPKTDCRSYFSVTRGSILLACSFFPKRLRGIVEAEKVQLPGNKKMDAYSFVL